MKILIIFGCILCLAGALLIESETFEATSPSESQDEPNENDSQVQKTVEISCKFKHVTEWWAINYSYFCEQDQDLNIEDSKTSVVAVDGYHVSNKNNTDIRGFRVNNKFMHFFPQNLDKFFPNLEFIAIWTTGLKEIHQSDLKPFTDLRILSIWENEIEVLEQELLKFNDKIEYIGFGKNKIKRVEADVFSSLSKLHTLHFDRNDCHSEEIFDDRSGVLKMIEKIESDCKVLDETTTNKPPSTVVISCKFKESTDWWPISYAYFCEQQRDLEVEDSNTLVVTVDGNHLSDQKNADVRGFRIESHKMHYFPQNLDKFFPNLEFIAIWTTGLKEIHQNDLKPFTGLRILSIWENEIEVLERELLKFNDKIEYIGFGKNKIKRVEADVFSSLSKLHTLHFDRNDCHSEEIFDDLSGVLKMIEGIERDCQSIEVV